MAEPVKLVRVVVYVDPQEHRKLKSVLALEGKSVSEWARNLISKKVTQL